MLLVQIRSTTTTSRDGVYKTGSRAGQSYTMVEQEAWVNMANGEVRLLKLLLRDGGKPYAVGEYQVAPESFNVGDFGRLEVGRVVLVPSGGVVRKVAG